MVHPVPEDAGLRIFVVSGDETVLRLEGELDVASGKQVEAAAALVPASARSVTIDLAELTFLDGWGVEGLAAFHAAQVLRGRAVHLRSVRPPVRRILDILGMGAWLSEDAATAVPPRRLPEVRRPGPGPVPSAVRSGTSVPENGAGSP